MIHIEKLSLKNVTNYSWQTFTDNFLGTKLTRKHFLEIHTPGKSREYINTNILTSKLLCKLTNVTLGKYYGTTGIDIDYLIIGNVAVENLVVEISPEHLSCYPVKKLKLLLENYVVILNDFEEGGNLYNLDRINLIKFLTARNIKPKQLFLVGGVFQQTDYPALNIHKIHYDYWLIVTATISDFFNAALDDCAFKQSMLDQLEQTPDNFCLMPIFKPRQHRLELLAHLDSIGILDLCDWSLAYNYSRKINRYNSMIVDINTMPDHVKQFLSSDKYSFPKLLPNLNTEWSGILAPNPGHFNKYKYFISAETHLGHELRNELGDCGFITEKTYKCFLTGSSPIIYGPSGSASYLNTLGFKTSCPDIECNAYKQVANFIKQKNDKNAYEKDLIQHNFDLITDSNFLTDQIVKPLHKIADLINSVRR